VTKIARFSAGHEERFRVEDSEVHFLGSEGEGESKKRRFKATAYTGVDIGRFWGRMVVNSSGIKRDEKMGMLLEHNDYQDGVAVCEKHEVSKSGRITLEGYFLSEKASDTVRKVLAAADEGWPWKMSIGIRFLRYHDLAEDAEEEVNGRKFKGPITIIDESHLFETSFIRCSPADLDTEATVMRAKARERQMADKPENAAAMAAALTNVAPAPAPAATALSGEEREKLLKEGEARALAALHAKEAAFSAAFPKQPKFVARMIREGKTLDEAKEIDRLRLREKLAKVHAENTERDEALRSIGNPSTGAAPSTSYAGGATAVAAKLEDRVEIEFVRDNRLAELWGDESRRAYLSLLKAESRRSTSGKPILGGATGLSVERMTRDLVEAAKSNGQTERLGIGKVGPDLGRITVKGFVGTFYTSYEEALSPSAFQRLAYQLQSDQEAEIVRWLGAPPQLQEWKGTRIAKDLPVYTQLLQNKLFEATLKVSKWDFNHQKFDLINKAFGQMGGVTSQHWDQIFSALLESNPTSYDTLSFFSKVHTLGGDSGVMSNDLTSGQGYASLAIADPSLPTQIEAARILMQCTPHARTFKWANGIPMNGQARRWGVMVHPNFEGIFLGATSSDRLDTGQSNPLAGQKGQFEVIPNPFLTLPQYVYLFRLDTPNSPFLKAEPEPIQMNWQGPGSHYEFIEHAFAMGLESARGIAPGAWESAMRLTLGAAA
jgi:hypothetical protein